MPEEITDFEGVWSAGDCTECPDGELFTDGREVWCDICDFIDAC